MGWAELERERPLQASDILKIQIRSDIQKDWCFHVIVAARTRISDVFWNTRRKIWAIVRARAAARSRTYYQWIWTFSRAAARISSLLGERWIKYDVVISCTNLWQKSQSNVTCLVKVVDAQHFSKIKYGWDIFDIKFKRLVMIYIFISNIPANHFKLTL